MKQFTVADSSRYFIDASFDDFDALTDAARAWNLDFMQLERGCFRGEIQQCGIEGAQISRVVFNRKLEQQGESPAGMRTFAIPVNRDISLSWRRQDVDGNDLLIFPDARELASVSNESFDMVTFSLDESLLDQVVAQWGDARVSRAIRSREVIRLLPETCEALRVACLAHLKQLTQSPNQFAEGRFDVLLRNELSMKLVQSISASLSSEGVVPKLRKRAQAFKRAHDAIVEHAHVPITVGQLCSITGTSARALQYACQEKYGLTPKAYIQVYRLNQVRKVLRVFSSVSHQVTDVANDWGFWHMGQFAKDYRRLFGELPSDTLKAR